VARQRIARNALLVGLALLLSAGLATAGEREKSVAEPLYATLKTNSGVIVIRLFEDKAPKTVENFVGLATGAKEWTDSRTGQKVKQPLYNGTIFHRVIPGFMIQGGDPLGRGTGGPGYRFADEFHPDLRHNKAGILSMANAGPTPTAASSSSLWDPPRTWTTDTPSSAKSSRVKSGRDHRKFSPRGQ